MPAGVGGRAIATVWVTRLRGSRYAVQGNAGALILRHRILGSCIV